MAEDAAPEGNTSAGVASGPGSAPPSVLARARRLIRIVFAFTLLLLGFVGIIAPLIPGWPLALVGLSILAAEYVWARRLLKRLRRRTGSARSRLFRRK